MAQDGRTLVHFIEQHPAIWDNKDINYVNRFVHREAWKTISTNVKASVPYCKRKWSALRSSYARIVRQGFLHPNKPRVKWYLEDQMSFLRNSLVERNKRRKLYSGLGNSDIQPQSRMTRNNPNSDANSEASNNIDELDENHIEIINQSIFQELNKSKSTSLESTSVAETEKIEKVNASTVEENDQKKNQIVDVFTEQFSTEIDKLFNSIKMDLNSIAKDDIRSNNKDKNKLKKLKGSKSINIKKKSKKKSDVEHVDNAIRCILESLRKEPNYELLDKYSADDIFFLSIEMDYEKLPENMQRKFKLALLNAMNQCLDEEDVELKLI